MAEQSSLEQETVQYYNWLMRLEHSEFEKELLEIVSIHFCNIQIKIEIRNNLIQLTRINSSVTSCRVLPGYYLCQMRPRKLFALVRNGY